MVSLIIGLSLLLQGAGGQSLVDEFVNRLITFDKQYTSFKVDLMGCPQSYKTSKDALDPKQCKPDLGEVNVHTWIELRKQAIKAFELQEIPAPK